MRVRAAGATARRMLICDRGHTRRRRRACGNVLTRAESGRDSSRGPRDFSKLDDGQPAFDAEATLAADIQRLSAQKAADKAAGSPSSDSSSGGGGGGEWQDRLNTALVVVFFIVLGFGAWLAAAAVEKSVAGTTVLSDTWFQLWPVLIQPAIGILMAASLFSGLAGWARENFSGDVK
jgi:hypothetical protein